MKVWIYNIFTTDEMWCKCVSKYCICDINIIVNIKDSFTIAEMSHIQYLHTHLNSSKYKLSYSEHQDDPTLRHHQRRQVHQNP